LPNLRFRIHGPGPATAAAAARSSQAAPLELASHKIPPAPLGVRDWALLYLQPDRPAP
jgi:hypothetical protein